MTLTDLTALAERLREESIDKYDPLWNHPLLGEAADAIDALILALEDARKVIEPFAPMADLFEKSPYDRPLWIGRFDDGCEKEIRVADVRAARDWLAKQVTK